MAGSNVYLGNRKRGKTHGQGLWLVACLALFWLLLPVLHTAGSHEIELGGSHCVVCQALAHATVLLVGAALVFLFLPAATPFPVTLASPLRAGARFSRSERGPPSLPV